MTNSGDNYMDLPPLQRHSLIRTSPKGHSFVGTCTLCGKTNLTICDMNLECKNPRGLSQEQTLLEAITGERKS